MTERVFMAEKREKPCIFLAGDSTVQSYGPDMYPFTGWGMVFHEFFREEKVKRTVPSGSDFPQTVRYETDGLFIDNRAMAGRSSRSFFDEGRLSDIERCIQEGDFLFAQFAHNDANEAKEERFVTPDKYEQYLLKYKDVCDRKGAVFVLVTAIAMRELSGGSGSLSDVWERGQQPAGSPDGQKENARTEPGKEGQEKEDAAKASGFFPVSFPAYRDRCLLMGEKYDIPVLDLGFWTAARLNELGPEPAKELFMWFAPGEYENFPEGRQDNAHLRRKGALEFAGILAQLIKGYRKDDRLEPVKMWLK